MSDDVATVFERVSASLTSAQGDFACRREMIGGLSALVYAHAAENVADLLQRAEHRFPERVLVVDDGGQTTYAQAFAGARQLAARLRTCEGIGVGDRVGIAMHNRADWVIAFAAVVQAGAVAVLFNSRAASAELAAAARSVPCGLVLADDERAARMRAAGIAARLLTTAEIAAGPRDLAEAPAPRAAPGAPATILFTSGTSGPPKGVVLSHRNLTNMDRNIAFITASTVALEAALRGVSVAALRDGAPPSVTLLLFPLFHISGLTAFFRAIDSGGQLVMMQRWRPAEALRLIAQFRVTALTGPPLIVRDLLDQPAANAELANVTSLVIGGQTTPRSLIDHARRTMAGAAQSVGWGMTEVCGAVTAAAGSLYLERPESCGVRLPITELRVVDEQGADLPSGQAGEILIRGALVMDGYFDAPAASEAAFCDGWLRSGDIGLIDAEGFVHLVDRKKDVVISSGENIYCGEVENVLGSDPAFAEVALFGVPDARLGERAILTARLAEGVQRTEADVKAMVRAELADYKVPAEVCFDLAPFARNATGKIDKAELRSRYLRSIAQQPERRA